MTTGAHILQSTGIDQTCRLLLFPSDLLFLRAIVQPASRPYLLSWLWRVSLYLHKKLLKEKTERKEEEDPFFSQKVSAFDFITRCQLSTSTFLKVPRFVRQLKLRTLLHPLSRKLVQKLQIVFQLYSSKTQLQPFFWHSDKYVLLWKIQSLIPVFLSTFSQPSRWVCTGLWSPGSCTVKLPPCSSCWFPWSRRGHGTNFLSPDSSRDWRASSSTTSMSSSQSSSSFSWVSQSIKKSYGRISVSLFSILPSRCHQGNAEVRRRILRWARCPGRSSRRPDANAHEVVQSSEELLHLGIRPLPLPVSMAKVK